MLVNFQLKILLTKNFEKQNNNFNNVFSLTGRNTYNK